MKVSVCVPVYNGERCLGNALDSLRAQTRRPDEVVVVDDCSRDGSEAVVRQFGDLPIRYLRNERNLGMIGNWNACLAQATGDILAFLHQDDGYHPRFVEAIGDVLATGPAVGFCAGSEAMRGTTTPLPPSVVGLLPPAEIGRLVVEGSFVPPPTRVAFRAAAVRAVGAYDEHFRYAAEPDLYVRLALAGWNYRGIADLLVWRTAPPERATERFGASHVYFHELGYFLDRAARTVPADWNVDFARALRPLFVKAEQNIIDHLRANRRQEAAAIEQVMRGELQPLALRVRATCPWPPVSMRGRLREVRRERFLGWLRRRPLAWRIAAGWEYLQAGRAGKA